MRWLAPPIARVPGYVSFLALATGGIPTDLRPIHPRGNSDATTDIRWATTAQGDGNHLDQMTPRIRSTPNTVAHKPMRSHVILLVFSEYRIPRSLYQKSDVSLDDLARPSRQSRQANPSTKKRIPPMRFFISMCTSIGRSCQRINSFCDAKPAPRLC